MPGRLLQCRRLCEHSPPALKAAPEIGAAPVASFAVFGHWGIFSQIFKSFFNVDTADETRAINENTAVSKLVITDESIRQLEYWNDHGHGPGLETTL